MRKNHNEFERRRRDLQRQRLEELRGAIPGLNEKSSMIAVLAAAKEYIDQLKGKSAHCRPGMSAGAFTETNFLTGPKITLTTEGFEQDNSRLLPLGQCPKALGPISSRSPLKKGTDLQAIEFNVSQIMREGYGMPELRKASSDSDEAGKPIRRGRSKILEQTLFDNLGAPLEHSYQPSIGPLATKDPRFPNVQGAITNLGNLFRPSERKDSGLIMPTQDPNVLVFGQRESINNLFSVPLPGIMEPGQPGYVACAKCGRGVENLIMIDCDVCHRWYHIRCIGIMSTSIPVRWSCAECPKGVAVGSLT